MFVERFEDFFALLVRRDVYELVVTEQFPGIAVQVLGGDLHLLVLKGSPLRTCIIEEYDGFPDDNKDNSTDSSSSERITLPAAQNITSG